MRYKKCCCAKKKHSNRKRKYKNPQKKYVPFPPRVRTRPAADASARTWAGCASSGLSPAGRRWRIQGVGGRRAGWRGCPGLTWARWGPRSGGQSRRIQGVGGRRAGWRGCPGLTWARWGPRSGGQSRVWARKKRERVFVIP